MFNQVMNAIMSDGGEQWLAIFVSVFSIGIGLVSIGMLKPSFRILFLGFILFVGSFSVFVYLSFSIRDYCLQSCQCGTQANTESPSQAVTLGEGL